jgi:hypothetical protein
MNRQSRGYGRQMSNGLLEHSWKRTHIVFKRDDTMVSASDAGKRGGLVGWFQAVDQTDDGV